MLLHTCLTAQVYVEKQSRHRFAQMTLGLDFQHVGNGTSTYISEMEGSTLTFSTLPWQSSTIPRFIIGGTHFWGHADFYIAIPFGSASFESEGQQISYGTGVETVLKAYPWRMEDRKIRPYIGISLAPIKYKQDNSLLEYGDGPRYTDNRQPLLCGLTYLSKGYALEAGITYDYTNKIDYPTSHSTTGVVATPRVLYTLSYRYMFDTTLEAEADWDSGYTQNVTEVLADRNELNGFFVGAGMSAALWSGTSSYNTAQRPYISTYGWSLLPEFSLGYYDHDLDAAVIANHRSYTASTLTYGTEQAAGRRSLGVEALKFIGDYHGFVPFVGIAGSYELLSFSESHDGDPAVDIRDQKPALGIVFGWDIRPNRLQSFLLRTNLRYYPSLHLDTPSGDSISFNTLEFNFIQLVVFPGRM